MTDIEKSIEENGLAKYQNAAEKLLSSYSAEDLAAALVKSMVKDPTEVPVQISPQRPLPNKDRGRKGRGKGNYSNKRNSNRGGNRSYSGKKRSGDKGGRRSNRRSNKS